MNTTSVGQRDRVAIMVIAAMVAIAGCVAAHADEPMVAIRQVGGSSSIYAVSEIERMSFDGDTLVVASASGVGTYAAAAIMRIEFLWDFSDIADPEDVAGLRQAMHLFQNQPNPFSPETRIEFELPQAGPVELVIYSPDGRLVRRLVDGERTEGRQAVRWDGLDDACRKVPSGVYFYTLKAPGIMESRQMILVP